MYYRVMKGKLDKAVGKVNAILEGHFASLPPAERERKERAFISAAKKSRLAPGVEVPGRPKS